MLRIVPSRLVAIVRSATSTCAGSVRSSGSMIPAVVTRTSRPGCAAVTASAAATTDAGSVTSSCCGADAGVLRGDPVQQLGAPSADDDGAAGGLQAEGQAEADARGAAGDEDGAACGVHGPTLRRRPPPRQRAPIQGLPVPGWAARRPGRITRGPSGAGRLPAGAPGAAAAGRRRAARGPAPPDRRAAPRGGGGAGDDVHRLLHPAGAAARPAAVGADAVGHRAGAAADPRRARPPVPAGRAQRAAADPPHRPRGAGAAAGLRPAGRHPGARAVRPRRDAAAEPAGDRAARRRDPARPAWLAAPTTAGSPTRSTGGATPRPTTRSRVASRRPGCGRHSPPGRPPAGPRRSCGGCAPSARSSSRCGSRHEVGKRFEDAKTIVHPELGAIDVDCQALFTENQAQVLLVLTAAPGTEAAEKLQLLSVIGEQQFAP